MKTVIIGGVAGGATAAARLRRLDEHAQIVLLERGAHISFANCGLPYYVGGKIEQKSQLILQTPESFQARFQIDVRPYSEAVSIDRAAKTVRIRNLITNQSYEETYDKLLLAPGAKPIQPPIQGLPNDRVFTLRNVPDTIHIRDYIENEHPSSAIVVGGGYIGLEMAENLSRAGLQVTVVELADHLIAPLDYDMSCAVRRYLQAKGVQVVLQNGLASVCEAPDGSLIFKLNQGEIRADMAILSIGVRPESELAQGCGLAVNQRGCIVVDSHMRTGDPDIYAVGDAVQVTELVTEEPAFVPLAGPANKQGRIAADNICGIPSTYTGTQGSAVLKLFEMTVATTGINERTARAAGLNYDKVHLLSPSHASYYPGGSNMSIKVVFERDTGRILGAQLVGFDGVDKRCDLFAAAIRLKLHAKQLTELELCYAPPFSSAKDPVNMAGYVIENLQNRLVKNFHWHDVANLPRDGSVTLLDVRTDSEYAAGAIPGFKNIPLDSLRDRLQELDMTKPVYVHCRSGQRSYLACRILSQNGYDCYNLSGGYELYHSIFGAD